MRFLRHPLILLAGLLVLAGCTSTEVISNKDPDFNGQVDKIYVSSRITDALDKYERSALDAMSKTMTAQDVNVVMVSEVVPGDDAAKKGEETPVTDVPFAEAREQGSTMLLVLEERDRDITIRPNFNTGGSSSPQETYSLNASLYDVDREKRVWRAELETKGNQGSFTSGQGKEGRIMAESLMEKFVEDGLLPANFNTDSKAFE